MTCVAFRDFCTTRTVADTTPGERLWASRHCDHCRACAQWVIRLAGEPLSPEGEAAVDALVSADLRFQAESN